MSQLSMSLFHIHIKIPFFNFSFMFVCCASREIRVARPNTLTSGIRSTNAVACIVCVQGVYAGQTAYAKRTRSEINHLSCVVRVEKDRGSPAHSILSRCIHFSIYIFVLFCVSVWV